MKNNNIEKGRKERRKKKCHFSAAGRRRTTVAMEEKIIAHGGRIAPDERSNGPGVPGLWWILYLYSTTATLSHHKNEEEKGRIEIKENDNALQKQKKKT